MSSTHFFFIFVPILAFILLAVNLIFAPNNPYHEKNSVFECGFTPFLGQNRTQFSISFFIFALIFLLFDLEILLVYPYIVSGYTNSIYGLVIMLIFFLALTLGFAFELGKKALNIESRQVIVTTNNNKTNTTLSKINNLRPVYFHNVKNNSFKLNNINNIIGRHISNKIINNKNNKLKKIIFTILIVCIFTICLHYIIYYIFGINFIKLYIILFIYNLFYLNK